MILRAGYRHIGVLTLAGTAMAAGPLAAQDQQPLVIARHLEINSLDPHRAFCDTCQIYLTAAYEGLVALAADNRSIEPLLATSWEINEDQTEFTFHLDEAAVFSDGSPVEAKDVKWSFERLKNIQGSPSFMMSGVSAIETPDEHTVVIRMEAPNSEFLGVLTAPYTIVINSDAATEAGALAGEDAVSADNAEAWFLSNSAGSGPYVLDTYRVDDELRFARNDNYWRAAPPIGEIVIDETADAVSQAQMLQSGAADIAMQIDPTTAQTHRQRGGRDRDGAVLQFHLRRPSAPAPRPTGAAHSWRCARPWRLPSTMTASSSSPSVARATRRLPRSPMAFLAPPTCRCPCEDLDKATQMLAEAGSCGWFRARRRRSRR